MTGGSPLERRYRNSRPLAPGGGPAFGHLARGNVEFGVVDRSNIQGSRKPCDALDVTIDVSCLNQNHAEPVLIERQRVSVRGRVK